MKPKKTKVCADCAKPKLLFKSEKEAQLFIDYNYSELSENPKDLRIYYCKACASYHISSKQYKDLYGFGIDAMIDRYKQEVKEHPFVPIKELLDVSENIFLDIPKPILENKRKTHEWLENNYKDINQDILDLVNIKCYNSRSKKHHI